MQQAILSVVLCLDAVREVAVGGAMRKPTTSGGGVRGVVGAGIVSGARGSLGSVIVIGPWPGT
jgi:hypothetical protein